jgi:hypothetical protein
VRPVPLPPGVPRKAVGRLPARDAERPRDDVPFREQVAQLGQRDEWEWPQVPELLARQVFALALQPEQRGLVSRQVPEQRASQPQVQPVSVVPQEPWEAQQSVPLEQPAASCEPLSPPLLLLLSLPWPWLPQRLRRRRHLVYAGALSPRHPRE